MRDETQAVPTATYTDYGVTGFYRDGIENQSGLTGHQASLVETSEEKYVSLARRVEVFNGAE